MKTTLINRLKDVFVALVKKVKAAREKALAERYPRGAKFGG